MKNILFLGCGKMGSILLGNLLEENVFEENQISILRKSEAYNLPKNYQADLVFICIKPQDSKEILERISALKIFHKNTIFISILAGKKIAFFENIFGKNAKIIRSMPNLPIQYSQGVFTYLCNKNITKTEAKNLEKIFEKFGAAFEISDEKLFDAATAIFGSGPAYIFLLQEIFTEIATSFGIKKSEQLVKKLFLGSALMSQFDDKNFSDLRKSVTSKKGTTESALKVLQNKSALKNIFKKAIYESVKRSEEFSKN